MNDLLGLGKGTDKLISAIERALGAVYRPYGIRREADAEAYRLSALEAAKTEAQSRKTIELARAKSEANIILAEGQQALKARLEARLHHEALRQQQNIERIVVGALTQPQPEPAAEDVDEDWLANFFEHARSVSGAQMQALWSRVLALEVGTPGSFSSRSLDVLRKMTRREAIAFQAACRLTSRYSGQANRLNILFGAAHHAWYWSSQTPKVELGNFGLTFLERVNLAQIGLIYEDSLVSGKIPRGSQASLQFASTHLRIRAKRSNVEILNYSLTPIGSELAALIALEEDSAYISALSSSLSKFFYVHNGTG